MLLAPLSEPSRVVVVASKGGDPRDPEWLLNVRADHRILLRRRGRREEMVAREADDEERRDLWPRVVARDHPYEHYQRRAGRDIPLVILERITPTGDPS
jgi:deazaflavin-dependent oxidoreductase (nitroreductase family)